MTFSRAAEPQTSKPCAHEESPDFSLQLGVAALELVVLVDFQLNSLHHEAMNLLVVQLLELLTQA
jgi:hypothetical protein